MTILAKILLQLVGLVSGISFAYLPSYIKAASRQAAQGHPMKDQLVRIEKHLVFLADLSDGKIEDITGWLLTYSGDIKWASSISKQLIARKNSVRNDIRDYLKHFPFSAINEKIQVQELKQVLQAMQATGDLSGIIAYWRTLSNFVNDGNTKKVHYTCQGLKDLSCIIHLFYAYLAGICAEKCALTQRGSFWLNLIPDQNNPIMNLLHIYITIDKLPLDDVISAIDRFVDEFAQALVILQGDLPPDDEEQEEAYDIDVIEEDSPIGKVGNESSFTQWLKEKWVLVPLSVGVIIIKTVYYFWAKEKEKEKESSSIFCLR